MKLAQGIGANPSKFMGTKTNISFLGKGPTKNPLFQRPVPGLEEHITSITLQGQRGAALDEPMISAVEDAMGFATANKLNDIQLKALTINLESLYKGLNPPVLPSASVTDIAPGIAGLKRFPKESHKFFGRPLKSKDFAEIDTMVAEGRIPGPGTAGTTAALDQKTGMSRAIARQILQQDTRLNLKPEELFMLKEGKGEPLDLMRKYYGRSVFNLDQWLDRAPYANFTSAKEAAAAALKEIELIPQFAEGGLAGILQVPTKKAKGGRIGFAEGETWKDKIGGFFSKLGWEGTAEDLRQEREMGWYLFPELADIFYPKHIYGGDKEKLGRYKKHMKGTHLGSHPQAEAWKKYKKWTEMENLERANIAKGGLAGILNL